MANNYNGYMLRVNGNTIPNHYFTDYESVPNQRQESNAELDQIGYIHRSTMQHTRTTIKFNTHILDLDQKIDFQQRMGYPPNLQRKVSVTYWNDETNDYCSGTFYLPDVTFSVMDANDRTILYNPIAFELIEC